jgi:hypothetical protein
VATAKRGVGEQGGVATAQARGGAQGEHSSPASVEASTLATETDEEEETQHKLTGHFPLISDSGG